jgi:NAD(P)-dependent dehydrogenase (short-subunit alcohol dehydrogenase family)
MFTEVDLSQQVAVVTGAGAGFGLAFCRTLAEHGATAIVAEINESAGQRAEATLRAEGLKAKFIPCDASNPDHMHNVARQTAAEFGRLDIWVNNAGLSQNAPSELVTPAEWQRLIGVMLSGTFYGSQAAGQVMLEQGKGNIINIASINGVVAQAGRASYSAAKAGIIRLTEVLASEWGPHNIRANAIAPAVIMTDLVRGNLANGSANMDVYTNRSPMRRLGEIPELLTALLFLVSTDSAYITGQTLRVDGAWASDHYL